MKLIAVFLMISGLAFGQAKSTQVQIGTKITGHFTNQKILITATVVKTKEAKGNPVEEGTPAEYEVRFSDPSIKAIKAGCCDITLINEGDLNLDGKDEISLYQAPMNGCTYTMTTYVLEQGNWKTMVKPFLIPTGCEEISVKELQNLVFSKNRNIYYLSKDMSSEKAEWKQNKVSSHQKH